jgi:5-deoxy-glucuronate isomerase
MSNKKMVFLKTNAPMAAHREKEDRQFGVVNVQPAFSTGRSGLEASPK